MSADEFTVALISDVFFDDDGASRLHDRLSEARTQGADLAVLPELPLNPWSAATTEAREDDAEPPNGPRAQIQAEAARGAGIALIGGAIVRDPATSVRHNTAVVFDAQGHLLDTYCKVHIPEEPGFWETSHYDSGDKTPHVIRGLAWPIGIQICSDANRPEGSQILAASGADAIIVPRATELATWARWRPVLYGTSLVTARYVLTVNRPAPEQGVLIGGPSFAAAPTGEVLVETTDPIAIARLDQRTLEDAGRAYPGYLPVRSDLYAEGWQRIAGAGSPQM